MKHEKTSAFASARAIAGDQANAQDWQQIATPGHANAGRVLTISQRMTLPALVYFGAVVLFGVGTAFSMSKPSGVRYAPDFIRSAFTYDEASYYDLGGGLRGGPKQQWLADFAPKGAGLSGDQYKTLVGAVAKEMTARPLDPNAWQGIPTDPAPKITRPPRVAEFRDRLKDGLILIPQHEPTKAMVLAHVEGQWAATVVMPGLCGTIMGPEIKECPAVPAEVARREKTVLFTVMNPANAKSFNKGAN